MPVTIYNLGGEASCSYIRYNQVKHAGLQESVLINTHTNSVWSHVPHHFFCDVTGLLLLYWKVVPPILFVGILT